MNRKGFTLIELLAVIIVLAVIAGIAVVTINYGLEEAKRKTENVYVKTLRDAIGIYLNSDGKTLEFSVERCPLEKTLSVVSVYESTETISFVDIIRSVYRPITESDMINPANESQCNVDTEIRIFRDEDYVYYYQFVGNDLDCLEENADEIISNLPDGYLPEGC